MKLSLGWLDIVIKPPPVFETVPLMFTRVLLPVDWIASVPLLVSVPSSVAVNPFWTVAVLPVLMVTPLSVLFPTYIAPPAGRRQRTAAHGAAVQAHDGAGARREDGAACW